MIPFVPVRLSYVSESQATWDEKRGRRVAEEKFDAWAHVERRDVAIAGFTDADELVIVRRADLERLQAVRS